MNSRLEDIVNAAMSMDGFEYIHKKYDEVQGADNPIRIFVSWKDKPINYEWHTIFSWLRDYKMSRDVDKLADFIHEIIVEVLAEKIGAFWFMCGQGNIRIKVYSLGMSFSIHPISENDAKEKLKGIARDIIHYWYNDNDSRCKIQINADDKITFKRNVASMTSSDKAADYADILFGMYLDLYAEGNMRVLQDLLRSMLIEVVITINGVTYRFRPKTLEQLKELLALQAAVMYKELNGRDTVDAGTIASQFKHQIQSEQSGSVCM